jgi:hypothetical protein
MATVVNNPSSTDNGNSFLIGVLLLIAFVVLLLLFGLPWLSSMTAGIGNGVQVTVPERIDVNVQQPK